MRILIVDDNESMRGLLRDMMEAMHHDVIESGTGADAVDQYHAFHPNLVLMDIRMPGMDGLEATMRIRDIDPCARVAIVTDFDEYRYRDMARKAGAEGYFLKEDLRSLASYVGN